MIELLPKAIVSGEPIPPMQLEVLATDIDFRPDTESVDDQKAMGSCVAHAGQTALEISYARAGQPTDLSRMYLYYWVQKLSDTLGSIAGGAFTGKIGEAVEAGGLCLEATYPYDVSREGREPPIGAAEEARAIFPLGSTSFTRPSGLAGIKRALNRGMPVMITMYVHREMMDLTGPWRTHTWDINAMPVGLHAVCVIGYDDAAQRLLVENSWSSAWGGDGGFFGIRYDHAASQYLVLDAYAFDKLPVALFPVPQYVAEDPAKFDIATGILTMPTFKYYTPDWGVKRFKNVAVRIIKPGRLTIDDPAFANDETSYFIQDTFMKHEQMLGLVKVDVDGFHYPRVTLVGAEYEILCGEPA